MQARIATPPDAVDIVRVYNEGIEATVDRRYIPPPKRGPGGVSRRAWLFSAAQLRPGGPDGCSASVLAARRVARELEGEGR